MDAAVPPRPSRPRASVTPRRTPAPLPPPQAPSPCRTPQPSTAAWRRAPLRRRSAAGLPSRSAAAAAHRRHPQAARAGRSPSCTAPRAAVAARTPPRTCKHTHSRRVRTRPGEKRRLQACPPDVRLVGRRRGERRVGAVAQQRRERVRRGALEPVRPAHQQPEGCAPELPAPRVDLPAQSLLEPLENAAQARQSCDLHPSHTRRRG